jgi:hypothetical protein
MHVAVAVIAVIISSGTTIAVKSLKDWRVSRRQVCKPQALCHAAEAQLLGCSTLTATCASATTGLR